VSEGQEELRPLRKQVKDLREGDFARLYGTVVEIAGTPSPGASPHGSRRPPLLPGWVYVPMEWAGVRCAPPEEALTWVPVTVADELPRPDKANRAQALAAQVTYPAVHEDDEAGWLVTSGMYPQELKGRHCKWCGEYVTLRPARLPEFDTPYIAEFEHVKTGLAHCALCWVDGNVVAVADETAQACFEPGCLSNDEHEAGEMLVERGQG
jgi:hypothetical protein